jgi:hypothetical protein
VIVRCGPLMLVLYRKAQERARAERERSSVDSQTSSLLARAGGGQQTAPLHADTSTFPCFHCPGLSSILNSEADVTKISINKKVYYCTFRF